MPSKCYKRALMESSLQGDENIVEYSLTKIKVGVVWVSLCLHDATNKPINYLFM